MSVQVHTFTERGIRPAVAIGCGITHFTVSSKSLNAELGDIQKNLPQAFMYLMSCFFLVHLNRSLKLLV